MPTHTDNLVNGQKQDLNGDTCQVDSKQVKYKSLQINMYFLCIKLQWCFYLLDFKSFIKKKEV